MIDRKTQEIICFSGVIFSVQPRSSVWRYRPDNRSHSRTGYNIFLKGTAEGTERVFSVRRRRDTITDRKGRSASGS